MLDYVLVCGSRSWRDGEPIHDRIRQLHPSITVVQGGAQGVDLLARGWAWRLGMGVVTVRPDYRRHGVSAPYRRNEKMADLMPSLCIAFWDGKSRGTKHMIKVCQDRGIPVEIHYSDGTVEQQLPLFAAG